ncbi:syncytin-A-like [Xyrauchen texanus]|uniref:syncytin-A-like n=1 Tax=Xyrauchen texanus TaxID=154827 RepID=UPI00224202DC|nr:syncytin-A-like [Xyrauchen texanus]
MIKIVTFLTIMDITQSVDSRNNIFLELMNMSRSALFAGKDICMPHAPSVGAGIPWVAHPISKCDTCTFFDHHTSGLYNKDTCHNVTVPPPSPCCIPGLPSCNLTSAPPIMTDLLLPMTFPWCMENYAPASTPLGEIPRELCSFVVEVRTKSHVDITPSAGKEDKDLEECLHRTPSLPKLLAINQWCMIPPPTGIFWLCGTSVYNILPSRFNGRCTLVYVLPAIRENTHSTPSSTHLQNSPPSTNKEDGCIPGLTCAQTWWSRTLGAIIPSYGVMQALDQVRSLSNSVQKLANDTALALGNIKDTLASHKIMILQNRVALDYILATQGEPAPLSAPSAAPV